MNRQKAIARHNCQTRKTPDRFCDEKSSKTTTTRQICHKVDLKPLQSQVTSSGHNHADNPEMMTVGNSKPCIRKPSLSPKSLMCGENVVNASITNLDDATIESDWRSLIMGNQKTNLGVKTSTSCESEADAQLTYLIIGDTYIQMESSKNVSIESCHSSPESDDLSTHYGKKVEDHNNITATTSNLWSQKTWSEGDNSLTLTSTQPSVTHEKSENKDDAVTTGYLTNYKDSHSGFEKRLCLFDVTVTQEEKMLSDKTLLPTFDSMAKSVDDTPFGQGRETVYQCLQRNENLTTKNLRHRKTSIHTMRNTNQNRPPYRPLTRSDGELQMCRTRGLNVSDEMTVNNVSIDCSDTFIECEVSSIEVLQTSFLSDKVNGEPRSLDTTMDAKSESDGIQINVSNGASDVAILVGNIGDTPTKTMRDLLWEKLQDDDVRKATSDIIVSVEKREFPAHKFILYVHSCYFRKLIEKTPQSQSLVKVEVYSVTAQYFQILYNYLYSGQLKIKHDDLKGVLESAWMLEMTGLPHSFWTFSICFLCFLSSETNPSSAIPLLLLEFLDESFDVTGALHMYDFLSGRENIQESLLGNIHLLLVKHFGRIINSLDFLRLPATKVLKILGDDAISVPSELKIFQAAIGWMTYDWKARNTYAGKLIRCVRFSRMPREELLLSFKEMERLKIVDDHEVKNVMMEAMTCKMYQQGGHNTDNIKPNERPRHCIVEQRAHLSGRVPKPQLANCTPEGAFKLNNRRVTSILVLGGMDPLQDDQNLSKQINQSHSMYLYIPDEEKWMNVGLAPKSWHDAGITIFGDTVYVCGGTDTSTALFSPGHNASPETWSLDTNTCVWSRLPDMKTARVHHTALAWQGKVYAIGGIDSNNTILNLVECYSPVAEAWSLVSIMPFECLGAASCEFHDLLWICGGIVKSKCLQHNQGEITDLVQVYNPRKNRWYLSSSLRIPRAFASLTVVKNRLFLVGGISPSNGVNIARSISDVDVFDLAKNEWQHYTDLFHPRHCCGSASVGRYFYAIGGVSSALGEVLTSVERYDTMMRKWDCLGAELPIKLTGMGCVVLPPTDTSSVAKELAAKYSKN